MKRFRLLALTLALVCFGVATAFAGDPIGRPNTPVLTKKVDGFAFVVDTSGSMMMTSPVYSEKKIVLARDLVGAINARIPSLDYNAALFTICPAATKVQTAAWDRSAYGKAVAALPTNLEIFDRLTNLGGDMQAISSGFSASGTKAVFLVTDGWANIGPDAVDSVRAIFSANPSARLHIISLADTAPGKASIAKLAALSSDTVMVNAIDLLTNPVAIDEFINATLYTAETPHQEVMTVYFATGSHKLDSRAMATLDQAASHILNVPHGVRTVTLIGFTDNTGSFINNEKLSENRSLSVKDYLMSKGVSANVVYTTGDAISYRFNNATADGRSQNRRVDLVIN